MPKKNSKQAAPSTDKKEYETAERTWNDFAGRLGEQISQGLKERAEYQRDVYAKWIQFLRAQGVTSDDKITGAAKEYENLYRHWTEFAEKTGEKITESMMGAWDEQKGKYASWLDMVGKRAPDLTPPAGGDYKSMVNKSIDEARDFATKIMPREMVKAVEFPKESYENWIRAYTETIEIVLKSPAFVSFLGTMLDTTMDIKKKNEDTTADIIRTIGLPSRKDMDDLYHRVHELTRKINAQSQIIKRLERVNSK